MADAEQDAKMAGLARRLAEALIDFAYSRDPESRKRVMQLHTELCACYRAEPSTTDDSTGG